MRILGLDPGLRRTGWGVIEAVGDRLRHCANGTVTSDDRVALAERLLALHDGLAAVIADWQPAEAAVEESFVNKNPASTLKLGIARGVVLLVPARAGLGVTEYGANHIKKSVVGVGHADKTQVTAMVRRLLPQARLGRADADAADALAVAICHAHHRRTAAAIARGAAAAAASSSAPR